jgi:hypothetical protein
MATPAENLCSRSWRLRNSLWMAPAILLAGLATWVSFLYIGIKAKRRSWLVASALYGIAMIVSFVVSAAVSDGSKETSSGAETVGGSYMFVVWLGGIVHAAITNREWLRWKAHAEPVAWYAQGAGAAEERIVEPGSSVDDVLLGTTSGLTTPTVLAPPPPPPPPAPPAAQATAAPPPPPPPVASGAEAATVDLNAASVSDLETRLGLPRTVAERVVAERARLGGFTAVEQLLTEVGIEPHIYARIRDTSAVGSPQGSAAARSRGRRLEL